MRAFKYSGSKTKVIPHLWEIPPGTSFIIEPFAGSCAFSLNNEIPFAATDTSKELVEMWHWLQKSSDNDITKLRQYEGLDKVDIRTLGLSSPEMTYLRINIASAMVGQLKSWKIYKQHKLPIEDTCKLLPKIKTAWIQCLGADYWLAHASKYDVRTLLFIDPPYIGTQGNYSDKNFNHQNLVTTVSHLVKNFSQCPIILTYGDGAADLWPDFAWNTIMVKKVPNLRRGGTVDRREMVAYLGTWVGS